jgi:hypothetical protein
MNEKPLLSHQSASLSRTSVAVLFLLLLTPLLVQDQGQTSAPIAVTDPSVSQTSNSTVTSTFDPEHPLSLVNVLEE